MNNPYLIQPARTVAERSAALQLMIPGEAENVKSSLLNDLLELNSTNQLDLQNLYFVTKAENGKKPSPVLGAILLLCQPDDTATLWPPVIAKTVTGPAETSLLQTLLIQQARSIASQQGCYALQSILAIDDHTSAQVFTNNDLPAISTLLLMQKPASAAQKLPERLPEATFAERRDCPGLQLVPVEEEYSHPAFAGLLEQTYIDSDDFPELITRKSGARAVRTHQIQGEFDPRFWYRLCLNEQTCGVLLFTYHREWKLWELTYLGIFPEFRRQGLARYAIEQALSNVEFENSAVCLGVDDRNVYAIRLYKSLGFVVTARQKVHFCWLDSQT